MLKVQKGRTDSSAKVGVKPFSEICLAAPPCMNINNMSRVRNVAAVRVVRPPAPRHT